MRIKARDIERLFNGLVTVNNFTANGTSNIITTAAMQSLRSTAEEDGDDLVLTESINNVGIVLSQPVSIHDYEDIYGKVSKAGQDLVLSYYRLIEQVEVPYEFNNMVIAFDFVYCFDIANLSRNCIVNIFNNLRASIANKETVDPYILREAHIGQSIQPYNPNTATLNDAIAMSLIFG